MIPSLEINSISICLAITELMLDNNLGKELSKLSLNA